jgi:hypothetical protein
MNKQLSEKQLAKLNTESEKFRTNLLQRMCAENEIRLTPPPGMEWNRTDYIMDDIEEHPDFRPLVKEEQWTKDDEMYVVDDQSQYGMTWKRIGDMPMSMTLNTPKIRTKRHYVTKLNYWNKVEHVPMNTIWLRLKGNVNSRSLVTEVTSRGPVAGDRIILWSTLQNYEAAFVTSSLSPSWFECTVYQ